MKDGPISKLIITETGHRPTKYKKITDTLPVLCADKNYQGIDVKWHGTYRIGIVMITQSLNIFTSFLATHTK